MRTCKIACCVCFGCYIPNTIMGALVISCFHICFFKKMYVGFVFVHTYYLHIFNQRCYAGCNVRTTFRSTSVNHPGMEKGPIHQVDRLMALFSWNACIQMQRILEECLLRKAFLIYEYNILLGYQNLKC